MSARDSAPLTSGLGTGGFAFQVPALHAGSKCVRTHPPID
nr:MAG TPA: hypothetical protein [Caudoviricetes sp.]